MRIVAGEFRGRPLAAPTTSAIRPTSDRLREAVFDILAHGLGDPVTGAKVLDLFAGTGALALEALSRGAASALLVEEAVEARGLIRRNVETLGLTGRAKIFRRDATRLGDAGTLGPFSVVFVDPPYGKGLGEVALASAAAGGWLSPGAIAILEEDVTSEVTIPVGFALLDERKVGDSKVRFLAFGDRG